MCGRPFAATSARSGYMERRVGVSRHFRADRSRRPWFADSGSIGCRRDRGRLPLGPSTHSRPPAPLWLFAAGFPVDELAMNFPFLRVDHGYLKVLVVTQA